MTLKDRLEQQDWDTCAQELHQKGFAILKNILTPEACQELIQNYETNALYRKTIRMERYRFGQGEYKYFKYPLPDMIQQIRETVYPYLAPIANLWMKVLNSSNHFPPVHEVLQAHCHQHGQIQPTVLILKYTAGGFNTLHQDLYGEIYFPMQLVLFLNEPEKDYTGGEFVLTEQIPRAQSKANVLRPQQGDMLIFTTNFRPEQGSKGYYRVNMKHGVSPVHTGNRHTLGIIFHDALS